MPGKKRKTRKKRPEQARHNVRRPDGKFISPVTGQTNSERWNKPGVLGFAYWVKDLQPCILTSQNTYEPFKITRNQLEQAKQILAVDKDGNFINDMSLLIEPRRHGKSTLLALIVLWLFTSRTNITIQLLGNNEIHCRRVQYRTLKRIIRNTKKLSAMIPEKRITTQNIKYRSNIIQVGTTSFSSSFGGKSEILWCSDLHACPDLDPFNALQGSLLDSVNGLCLIDSNVDHIIMRLTESLPSLRPWIRERKHAKWIST